MVFLLHVSLQLVAPPATVESLESPYFTTKKLGEIFFLQAWYFEEVLASLGALQIFLLQVSCEENHSFWVLYIQIVFRFDLLCILYIGS